MGETPDWRVYERIAACFEIEVAGMGVSITPNATLIGTISGAARQIDVLVDARWTEDVERRIIFDTKLRKRKVDVKDVESFEGMMRDVGASRGVLVCSNGYTKAALARAQQSIEIRIVTFDEALELDFAMIDPCPHCRLEKHKTEGLVFWDGQFPLSIEWGWAIIFTGKCDVCHSFAFWCWDCGAKAVVPDEETYECGCEHTWFVERSDSEAIFVLSTKDGEIPLDRCPLR